MITSREFGAKAFRKMKESISTALIAFLLLSLLLGVMGFALSPSILAVLNTPENIMDDACSYLRIYFLGLPFLFMYNILSSVFNSLGRSRIPLCLLVFSSLLNIALDIVAVAYMGMGVAIPHGTTQAKGTVKKTGIVLLQYPEGVDFGSEKAQLVFGIAGIGDEHLDLLSKLCTLLEDEALLETLKTTDDVEWVLEQLS